MLPPPWLFLVAGLLDDLRPVMKNAQAAAKVEQPPGDHL
jgi:hypothetical protein